MKWRSRASRKAVETIVATFCTSVQESSRRLSSLSAGDWQKSWLWIDASGMALYFLERIVSLHLETSLPTATVRRLKANLADNRDRSSSMFTEFIALNHSFQAAGLVYANLKGFTLYPDYCPRPELRCQFDFDFLVDGNQLHLCQEILEGLGYELWAITPDVWEFKAGASQLTHISDHYKPGPQRSVELHFASSQAEPYLPFRDPRLQRCVDHSWAGATFPALSPADQFIAQSLHIYKHVCSACTRLSWLLEYQHCIAAHFHDHNLWNEVREQAWKQRNAPVAIGLATLLASQIFGAEVPPELGEWIERLPASVRLWANEYGRESMLADFPGTKLYLLLQEQLKGGDDAWKHARRRSLLPVHRAPRIVSVPAHDSAWNRICSEFHQARFLLFRLRFHVVEGARYFVESSRWRRRLATLHEFKPDLAAD
ncbi:MAG TPA: nucleotidyltransferase family protein [Acidobacteriaceae bacterium]|nr:nucleotidyltransferase family protein [Acidobacteriaceae bacterium]